ncbi:hypothetical protein NKH36_19015 [Mesorhizobium sp. M1312]|uniref:hypothetical protein n=1 Tax=unclassified Mesorhizobium TaxID=325217 RepID=UPI003339AAEF
MSRKKKVGPDDQDDPAWSESEPKSLKRSIITTSFRRLITTKVEGDDQPNAADGPVWSEADLKSLSRLIGKHGVEAVHRMTNKTAPRGRGRPSRGDLPYYEGMQLAQWLDEAAAEHRAKGTRNFASAAIYDLFVLTVDEHEHKQPGRFERFLKTTKRKWIEGRKELIQYLEATYAQHPIKGTRALAQKALQPINRCEK